MGLLSSEASIARGDDNSNDFIDDDLMTKHMESRGIILGTVKICCEACFAVIVPDSHLIA